METVKKSKAITADQIRLNLYPDEILDVDIVGEDGYAARVREFFGTRILRGTALTFCPNPIVDRRISQSYEPFLRKVFDAVKPKRAVEIGTLYGVTTGLLAHYSDEVVTVDINYQQLASYVWHYFGVNSKISNIIVDDDAQKKELLDELDFDFAFIDAVHTYDGVKFDFECVKKCGKVLFHDYGVENHPGITKFVDELPQEDVFTYKPFAFWEEGSGAKDNNNLLQ